MKTFKEYRKEKTNKIPHMETVMGSHSVPKDLNKIPHMETVMGSHSVPKDDSEHKVNEAFVDEDEYHNRVHNGHAVVNYDITKQHVKAIRDYTDDSMVLNRNLRLYERGDGTNHNVYNHTQHIERLDDLLNKHKTKEDFHVFTGVKVSPARDFVNHKKSQEVKLPSYTSTSTSIDVASSFAHDAPHYKDELHGIDNPDDETRHVLKIHVPKGSHAVSVRKHSFLPGEHEVLLHRGHHLMIDPKPSRHDHRTFVWNAKIIKHDPKPIE